MTTPHSHPAPVDQRIPCLASLVVLGIAAVAAAGWAFDLPSMTRLVTGLPPMQPITVSAFLLAGIALRLACGAAKARAPWPGRSAALMVLVIAACSLAAFFIPPDSFPMRRLLNFANPNNSHRMMSPHSAVTFLLSGSALLLAHRNTPHSAAAPQVLAALAGCVVLLAGLGYLYDVTRLYSVNAQTGMSLPTMLAFTALNGGILMLSPDQGITARVFSRGSGGIMLRRLWPAATAVPVALGWLSFRGELPGNYSPQFGIALMVTLTIVLLTWLIWRNARSLDDQDYALRLERERLAVTLASIGDAVIATDTAMRITFMNPVAATLTGWSQADALGRDVGEVFRIVDETTQCPLDNPVIKVLSSGHGQAFAAHACLTARDGRQWPIDDSNAPIRDESGRIIGAVLVFREIIERRRAEQALQDLHATLAQQVLERTQELRASEELYRRTLQALPAHIAVIDRNGAIMAVNQAWSEFADQNSGGKAAPDVAVGTNYLEVCRRAARAGDADASEALAGIDAVLAGTVPFHTMEYLCAGPETAYWFHMTVVPLDADGVGGAVISHLDITDRKHAEQLIERQLEELRTANEDLERFNRLTVGRELRIVELKQEVNALCSRLGQPPRYQATYDLEKSETDRQTAPRSRRP